MTFYTGITRVFDEPFYAGTPGTVDADTVLKYDVLLNGRGYLLDLNNPNAKQYSFESDPLLAAMFLQDRGTQPIGEHSINSRDYWRRSVDDWSAGAGQKYLDHPASINNQYRTSKGIDPWTQGQIGLLADTAQRTASDATNQRLVVAGSDLYYLSGTVLQYTTDITVSPSYTTVTGSALNAAVDVDMTSDGYTIWLADGVRTYYSTRGSATYAAYHTSDHPATQVEAAKGRLFTAIANVLYTHSGTAGGATATAYFTHPNGDWTWTAIEGSNDAIYFAGYSGTHSAVYAATIKADGTSLDVPVVVATLPTGEIVRSLKSYLTILVIGTDKGFRAATINAQAGQLTLGSAVTLSSPPQCFESQDRFVWFGYTNYDASSTGLGRIDLSTFNLDVPAYASDLMVTAQGTVSSVVTFQNLRVFTVVGQGLYAETTDKVSSGMIQSGWLNYALADLKIALKLAIQNRAGAGSYIASLAKDDDTAAQVGDSFPTNAVAGTSNTITISPTSGRAFEVTYTLSRSSSDTTQGPVLDRSTLMVEPAPERRVKFEVPILLHSQVMDRLGSSMIYYSPSQERQVFYNLLQSRAIVVFRDAETSWNVIVDDFIWIPYENMTVDQLWNGTLVVTLKVVS